MKKTAKNGKKTSKINLAASRPDLMQALQLLKPEPAKCKVPDKLEADAIQPIRFLTFNFLDSPSSGIGFLNFKKQNQLLIEYENPGPYFKAWPITLVEAVNWCHAIEFAQHRYFAAGMGDMSQYDVDGELRLLELIQAALEKGVK